MEFSFYNGNIKHSRCIGHISLGRFIKVHLEPKPRTSKLLRLVKIASERGDLSRKKILKKGLYAFTPSVFIRKGKRRQYKNIEAFTGLMQLDFDKIPDEETAKELKAHLFETYKSIVCIYISPSGRGVKALMKTTIPKDIEHYKALFKAVESEMERYGYLDHATTNCILPMFLSADPDLQYRIAKEKWTEEDWSVVDYVSLNGAPKTEHSSEDMKLYYNKTIDLVTTKMNNIVSDGHPQMRSASLILGSRVGAGYIDKLEAEQLITNLIQQNDYLKKDVRNYISTAMWAIGEGMKNAKYY